MLHNNMFVDDIHALFVHHGVTSRNGGPTASPSVTSLPWGLLRLPRRRPCRPSMNSAVSHERVSYPSSAFTVSRRSFACVPRTPPLEFVTPFCYSSLLRSLVLRCLGGTHGSTLLSPFRYARVRRTVVSWVEPPHVHELKWKANLCKKR